MSEGGPIESPAGAPAHQGFLSKRSDWLRVWRTRFFKLYMGAGGPRLYFMKDADAPPHGVIDLRTCLTVKTADEKTGKPHSFEVATGEQVFFMCAESAAAKDEVRLPRWPRAFLYSTHPAAGAVSPLFHARTQHLKRAAVGWGAGARDCAGRQALGRRAGGRGGRRL